MRRVITGPPRSGKSARAERLLLDVASPPIAYIATLPSTRSSSERIARHRERRGDEWVTWEMTDAADECLGLIERALRTHEHVLIDGASILAWRVALRDDEIDCSLAAAFLRRLSDLLLRRDGNWVVVDAMLAYPNAGTADPFNALMRAYHQAWRALAGQEPSADE